MNQTKDATINIRVDHELCGHCGACVSVCHELAITLADAWLNVEYACCIGCLACFHCCPVGAISVMEE